LRGNLYIMQMSTIVPDSARLAVLDSFPTKGVALPETALFSEVSSSRATIDTWHRRLGHLNTDAILRMMRKGMVKGMEITGSATSLSGTCEPCLKGKQTHMEVRKETDTRADSVLGRVFSDVCSKLPTRSHQGYLYFITWIDDKSRKVFVVGLKEKSDVAQHLKAFVSRAELETGERLKVLQTDGGGEYIGGPVQKFLEEKGIRHEITMPDTPQHNGVAERMNQTIIERVRTMLLDADLPESYWWEVLQYAALLHNVSPTCSLDDSTPKEAWSGNKPDVSCLRVFSCRAFVHIPDRLRDKFAAKSLICTFLGYARQCKAYRLVHRSSQRFLESRDVIFDEGGPHYERIVLEADNAGTTPAPPSTPAAASTPTTASAAPTPTVASTPLVTPPTPNVKSRPKRNI
jgi:transposase InsO family protein